MPCPIPITVRIGDRNGLPIAGASKSNIAFAISVKVTGHDEDSRCAGPAWKVGVIGGPVRYVKAAVSIGERDRNRRPPRWAGEGNVIETISIEISGDRFDVRRIGMKVTLEGGRVRRRGI